jgi:hypothetical protein
VVKGRKIEKGFMSVVLPLEEEIEEFDKSKQSFYEQKWNMDALSKQLEKDIEKYVKSGELFEIKRLESTSVEILKSRADKS